MIRSFLGVLLAIAVTCSGCVMYQGTKPPASESLSTPLCGASYASWSIPTKDSLDTAVKKGISDSGLVKIDPDSSRRLRLKIEVSQDGNPVLGFFAALTGYVIPCPIEKIYRVEGDVLVDGQSTAHAEATASVKYVFQVFLLFAMPFNNYSLDEETLTALAKSVCVELGRSPSRQ